MASWIQRTGILMGALALVACAGPSDRPHQALSTYPVAVPSAGDWFVYAVSRNSSPEYTLTRYFKTVAENGAMTRLDTYSVVNPVTLNDFDAEGALIRTDNDTRACRYAPPLRLIPRKGSAAGESFSTTSTESCIAKANQTTSLRALSAITKSESIELATVPIGTFKTFKYSQTRTYTSATDVSSSVESCWVDVESGRTVECAASYNTMPAGLASSTASEHARYWLVAYGLRGRTVGAAVRRFSGHWRVQLSPEGAGVCADLLIDAQGRITGECVVYRASSRERELTNAQGTVNAVGDVALALNNGTRVSGKLTSPVDGEGAWALEGVSGAWTARHL